MDDHSAALQGDPRGIGRAAETLLGYARNRTTFQTGASKTIPAAYYTDPARWEREREKVFERLPLMLAISAELPRPGCYKALEAMDRPVLITRDRDGVARAFLNVCAHRGAPVAPVGCGAATRLTCIYHAWSYGLDGRLLAVAGAETFGPIDKAARGLTALPCAERAGMIFVGLTPGIEVDFDGFFAGMLADFQALGVADFAYIGTRQVDGPNWKVAFDGNLEGYHFAALHPTTIHPRSFSNLTHYEAFGPHLRIGFAQTAIEEKLAAVARESWAGRENDGFDFVRILFPNVSVFVAPEITQFMLTFPGPTVDTNRTTMIYARREPPRDAADRAALEQMMDFLVDVVRDEDYATGRKIQQGLRAGGLDSVIFGRNERGNQFFHEYVDYYVNGGEPPVL